MSHSKRRFESRSSGSRGQASRLPPALRRPCRGDHEGAPRQIEKIHSLRQIVERILLHAVSDHFEVEMGAGGITGGTDVADYSALTDRVSGVDKKAAQVSVECLNAVAMIKDDVVAIAEIAPPRDSDVTGVGGAHTDCRCKSQYQWRGGKSCMPERCCPMPAIPGGRSHGSILEAPGRNRLALAGRCRACCLSGDDHLLTNLERWVFRV